MMAILCQDFEAAKWWHETTDLSTFIFVAATRLQPDTPKEILLFELIKKRHKTLE